MQLNPCLDLLLISIIASLFCSKLAGDSLFQIHKQIKIIWYPWIIKYVPGDLTSSSWSGLDTVKSTKRKKLFFHNEVCTHDFNTAATEVSQIKKILNWENDLRTSLWLPNFLHSEWKYSAYYIFHWLENGLWWYKKYSPLIKCICGILARLPVVTTLPVYCVPFAQEKQEVDNCFLGPETSRINFSWKK